MRKEKFVITSYSEDPADLYRDVAEINAKHGTNAQVVFDELAGRLQRRALEAVKRATLGSRGLERSQWLDKKQAGKWSDVDLAKTGETTYNTVKKYRTGAITAQTPKVRRGIANAFIELGISCEFSEVPE